MSVSSAVKRFRPLADRILVQVYKPTGKTAGGIYLPESAKSGINQAKVIAIGAGRYDSTAPAVPLPLSVKVGDNVIIPEYGGMAIKFDSEEYKIFRDDDLVGVVGEDDSAAASEAAK